MEVGLNEQLIAQLKAGEQAISRVDYQEAERIFRVAMAITQKDPDSRMATADIMECLARVCLASGRNQEARQYCAQVTDLRAEVLGAEHVEVARSRMALAQACERSGDHGAAAVQYRSAFSVLRQVLGPQDNETQACLKRSIAVHDAIRRKEAFNKTDVTWSG